MIQAQATKRGALHRQYEVKNQDAVCAKTIHGYGCAVLCDGVSLKSDRTFSQSEIASSLCSKTGMTYLEMQLKPHMKEDELLTIIKNAFRISLHMLAKETEKMGIPLYDCQTTMLIVIYHKGYVYAGIAGDGGVLYEDQDGELGLLITGLKTSSSVQPIMDVDSWKFMSTEGSEGRIHALIAATDGVFDSLVRPDSEGGVVVNGEKVDELFALSKVPYKKRDHHLSDIFETLNDYDDQTAVVMIDGRYPRFSAGKTEPASDQDALKTEEESTSQN